MEDLKEMLNAKKVEVADLGDAEDYQITIEVSGVVTLPKNLEGDFVHNLQMAWADYLIERFANGIGRLMAWKGENK